jgi:hypothetical protein
VPLEILRFALGPQGLFFEIKSNKNATAKDFEIFGSRSNQNIKISQNQK